MNEDVPSRRFASWALATLIATPLGGCHKQDAAPAAPVIPATEPAMPVPPEERFVLSNVRFRYDSQRAQLVASYTVSNRGDTRERVHLCIDFIDKDGFFVHRGKAFDRINPRPGTSDEFVDEEGFLSADQWTPTEVLRFSLDKQACGARGTEPRGASLFLDKTGRPLPPDSRPTGKPSPADEGTATGPWFRLENVRVFQNANEEVMLEYKATNLTEGRATSKLCVRLVNDTRCACQGIDEAETEDFNLGLGASARGSSRLELGDAAHWDQGRQILIYAARFGCTDAPGEATSAVLTLPKPRTIHAPKPSLEDGNGMSEEQLDDAEKESSSRREP
ncbi:hypothetical protein [Melittangium boletus]|uniref:hypothetical protein n=1 Tax=Melittangium boletus TaxID=83453 RepID=UPI003DA2E6A6